MSIARRHLPNISWLAAFEAAARLGSVTLAAQELDLTQGAVSRQILKLEDQLGHPLFRREKQRLILTPDGEAYAKALRPALSEISNATRAVARSAPEQSKLKLTILPAFGTYWLAPRLHRFLAQHPEIGVKMETRTAPFDLGAEGFHAAIHFGSGDWPGAQHLHLFEEQTIPVLSPGLWPEHTPVQHDNFRTLPRLQILSRQGAWRRWFAAQGWPAPTPAALQFDQFATMLEAVRQGLGVALVPQFMVADDVKAGRLMTFPDQTPAPYGRYALVWPRNGSNHSALRAFRSWLSAELSENSAKNS